MGILRLFLAVVVLLFHCPDGVIGRILHPALAVQCFYAISGFLIQNSIGKYRPDEFLWYVSFYKSRALRILPLYWLFAALTFIFIGHSVLTELLINHDFKGITIYWLTNIFILGQDVLRITSYDLQTHQFAFVPPFTERLVLPNEHTRCGIGTIILGQSWTLSVEFWFYLIAPFILFSSNTIIIGILAASIVFRLTLACYGYVDNNFMYGIIFSEIAIFLSGSLAARFYKTWLESGKLKDLLCFSLLPEPLVRIGLKVFCWGVLVVLYLYYSGWFQYPIGGAWNMGLLNVPYRYWATIAVTILALPWMFHEFGKYKWDRFIGDLSYPVYISHVFILLVLERIPAIPQKWIGCFTLVISIVVSILMLYLIERPIDRLRHRIADNKRNKLKN